MRVAVLGAGPTGLLAAAVATAHGASVDLYARRAGEPEPTIPGSSYLLGVEAERIFESLGISTEDLKEDFQAIYRGSTEDYTARFTGPSFRGKPFPRPRGRKRAPIERLNRTLFDRFGGDVEIWDARFDRMPTGYDETISTIPRFLLCEDPMHAFTVKHTYLADFAKAENLLEGDFGAVYSGDPEDFWSYSGIDEESPLDSEGDFRRVTEFVDYQPEYECTPARRPIATNCSCKRGVVYVGSQGRWSSEADLDDVIPIVSRLFVEPLPRDPIFNPSTK